MTQIQIPAVIRPALSSELFGANDVPFKNALFFTKKKDETCFSGPYYVLENANQENFIHRYIFRELYVIITEGEGFCFLMNLRMAEREDLVDGKLLRENQLYYIKESDDVIDGPHFLKPDTDPHHIAGLFNSKAIYVVDEKQNFRPFSLEKSA